MKIAGRDAGGKCVVVDVVDDNFVLVDGNVRRRRCSISHLEPLPDSVEIKKGASHEEVVAEFTKLGILAVRKSFNRKGKAQKSEKSVQQKRQRKSEKKVSGEKKAVVKKLK